MTPPVPRHARPRERGIALLMVMWIFMILGVIALDFSRYMRDDAMAGLNYADEVRGYYLAVGGMNRELLRALDARQTERKGAAPDAKGTAGEIADPDATDSVAYDQDIPGRLAGGQYIVKITDEAGKIPINTYPEEALRQGLWNLFVGGSHTAGGDRLAAADIDTVTDSILDWRDCGNEARPNGAESAYYNSLPRPYDAKNAFFDSPEELLLVRGVTPDLFYGGEGRPGLRDVISVYTKEKINLRTMTTPVMQMIFGIDANLATEMAAQRAELDPAAAAEQLRVQAAASAPQLADLFEDQEPQLVYVLARGNVDPTPGVVRDWGNMAAVVELSGDDIDGIKLVRWFDRAPWTGALPTLPASQGRFPG